jgi:hypothetical protein
VIKGAGSTRERREQEGRARAAGCPPPLAWCQTLRKWVGAGLGEREKESETMEDAAEVGRGWFEAAGAARRRAGAAPGPGAERRPEGKWGVMPSGM